MQLKAISENCSGCCTCRLICGLANYKQVNPAMAALSIHGLFPEPGTYEIGLCDQCGVCAEACPVEAIGEENGGPRFDRPDNDRENDRKDRPPLSK